MAILTIAQLKSLAQQVGLSGAAVDTAAAIAMAESGGNTAAYNPETAAGTPVGHGSRGLWQIYGAAHPQYDNSTMFDALSNARAMYAISNGGRSFSAWSTFQSGEYRQYLTGGSSGGSTGGQPSPVKSGAANNFPLGQCTWWADERYHDLTGYYVPWNGNAYQWEQGARASGWQVSTTPPQGIASIIIMQPYVQGAGSLGHVGIVENVNGNRTVTVSNMNWTDPNAAIIENVSGFPIRQTTIAPGAGISFAWATGASKSTTTAASVLAFAKNFTLAPNASVTQFLVGVDDYLALKNPFNVDTSTMQDSVAGLSFTDPAQWVGAVAANTLTQTVAIIVRLIFIIIGLYLLLRVVRNFVDASGAVDAVAGAAAKIGPMVAAL